MEGAQLSHPRRVVAMIEDIEVGGLPGRALLPHQSLDRPTIDRVARRRDQTLLHRRGGIEAQEGRREVAVTPPEDRKSVVQGKRVSVRVDLGGRRIIKKKNKTEKR